MTAIRLVGGTDVTGPADRLERDMTGLVVLLARRYRAEGMEHSVAAATAVAARGVAGLDRRSFARRFDLTDADLDACEAGRVPFGDLPATLGALVMGSRRVDLLQLADCDLTGLGVDSGATDRQPSPAPRYDQQPLALWWRSDELAARRGLRSNRRVDRRRDRWRAELEALPAPPDLDVSRARRAISRYLGSEA